MEICEGFDQVSAMGDALSYRHSPSDDAAGQNVAIRHPRRGYNTCAYTLRQELPQEPNQFGYVTTYAYDAKRRLTQDATTGANTHTYDYGYDGDGLKRTEQASSATVTTLIWDGDEYLGEV